MDYVYHNIWLIAFLAWGLPLGYYRSKFRKMVYETDSWTINIKPVFKKEIKYLFRNMKRGNKQYAKFRKFYLMYLLVYILLFIFYQIKTQESMSTKIEKGDHVPDFELLDQHGNLFKLESILKKKNIVIYFYPKDDTPGCTKEACTFRDSYEVFKDANAEVIGISAQSVESHLNFAQKHRLNFTLLSDSDNMVRKKFGVPSNLFGLFPGRTTYIINKKGTVEYVFNSQLQAERHVTESLRIIQDQS